MLLAMSAPQQSSTFVVINITAMQIVGFNEDILFPFVPLSYLLLLVKYASVCTYMLALCSIFTASIYPFDNPIKVFKKAWGNFYHFM